MVRKAFTLIELIFALVIMGVVFLTLPMILINNSSNLERNLMQEAIFASSTKMGQILTYHWDENSASNVGSIATSNVLETSGDSELGRSGTSYFRKGHIQQDSHRRMDFNSSTTKSSSTIGIEGLDDIDDFSGTYSTDLTGSVNGYKKDYNITTTVTYVSDAALYSATNMTDFDFTTATAPGTTNLKMIEITTYEIGKTSPILKLRAYSANIGEVDFYKRTY